MKSDPFAPIDSPAHVKNLSAAFAPKNGDPEAGRRAELLNLHLTGHEYDLTDAGDPPTTEELERRATLVAEYREQLAEEGPDAEAPTLEDATGHLYRWREGDRTEDDPDEPSGQPDGETSSGWYFIGEPEEGDQAARLAVPPRNGPGSDTETWRRFASRATLTESTEWADMNRTEIIAHLEEHKVIPSEHA